MSTPVPPPGGWQQQQQQTGRGPNGQAAGPGDGLCCGPECWGGPGKPGTTHYLVIHSKDGSINLPGTHERLPDSDLAAAALLRMMHREAGRPLLCGEQTRRWLMWDGSHYTPQVETFGGDLAERLAVDYAVVLRDIDKAILCEIARQMPGASEADIEKAAEAERKARWSLHHRYRHRLWSEQGQAALIKQVMRTCAVDVSLLDTAVGEIIVDGGRISYAQILQDGAVALLPHDPARLITRRMGAGVDYIPQATCPVFDEFLATSVADEHQRWWLCWRAANALFGRFPRKGFVNPIGETDSGKSTFTTVMGLLGGGYARSVEAKTFMVKHASDSGFLADELRGARLVSTHEPEPGARFAVGYLKAITGRDRQRTRGPYGRGFIEWEPQCTVFVGTNRPVAFDTSDTAVLGRQEPVRFAAGYTAKDDALEAKMAAELPGILNRLLACVLDEARHGRVPELPASMAAERERLADQTEPALQFVQELISEGRLVQADPRQVSASNCVQLAWLYTAFEQWCDDEGIRQPVKRGVFKSVVGRRYPPKMSNGCRFHGLMVPW